MTEDQFKGPSPAEGLPSARVMRAVRELRLVVRALAAGCPLEGAEPEVLRLAGLELTDAARELASAIVRRVQG